jgi:transposase
VGKRYRVTLEADELAQVKALLAKGKADVRRLKHAQVLLTADEAVGGPAWPVAKIAAAVGCGTATVERIRRRFVEEGLERALSPYRKAQREYRTKLDGEQEAKLIATACSAPPEGRSRWTLRLLADKLVELKVVESISHEAVRQALKKTNLNRIRRRCDLLRRRLRQMKRHDRGDAVMAVGVEQCTPSP